MHEATKGLLPKRELPIIATVLAIYRAVFRHAGYALRISWLWFIVIVLVTQPIMDFPVAARLGGDLPSASKPLFGLYLLNALAMMVGWSSIAVLWHRALLVNERFGGVPVQFDGDTIYYLGRFIFIILVLLIPLMIAGLLMEVFFDSDLLPLSGYHVDVIASLIDHVTFTPEFFLVVVPITLALTLACLRLSIALPAIALSDLHTISDAWYETDGNGLRLLAAASMTGIPLIALRSLSTYAPFHPGLIDLPTGLWMLNVLWHLEMFIIGFLSLTFISVTYGFFFEDRAVDTFS